MIQPNRETIGSAMSDLISRSRNTAKSVQRPLTIGTLGGGMVSIDSLGIEIPLSDMAVLKHWEREQNCQAEGAQKVDEEHVRPKYEDGALLLLAPLDSGDSYVVIGEV